MHASPVHAVVPGAPPQATNEGLTQPSYGQENIADASAVSSPFAFAPNVGRMSEGTAHLKDQRNPRPKPLLPSKAAAMLEKIIRPQMGG